MTQAVDLRCEAHPRRLLGRLLTESTTRHVDPGSNLLEFHCRECTRDARVLDSSVLRVLHRFDLTGDLIETVTVPDPG